MEENGSKLFNCPGCNMTHSFDNRWKWNSDKIRPTFRPSLLVRYPYNGKDQVCHSFVTNGEIKFLGDCTHELKNNKRELPSWDGIQIKGDNSEEDELTMY